MKFIDEVTIHVKAGKGGDGAVSFRREKYIPFGGPDGGDGGLGGSVYLVANSHLNTLVDFQGRKHYKAENGEQGAGQNRSGRAGSDCLISVPVGTVVFDVDTHECLGDLTKPDQRLCVALGGQGGKGNTRFKSSVQQAPRKMTPGTPAEVRQLRLELKLIADVGLLGMPNAGKSTFLRAISKATPKVADYPFTTLVPKLGVVKMDQQRQFVVADIPGLIEGAADGAGLGHQFLRHVQRTRVLLHLVDMCDEDPAASVNTILNELDAFDDELLNRPRWLVLNKRDAWGDQALTVAEDAVKKLNWQAPWFCISALSGEGVSDLIEAIWAEFFADNEAWEAKEVGLRSAP